MYRLINLCILIVAATGRRIQDQPSSIINGELANIEDFPYYVFLGTGDKPENRRLHCGGAIIRPDVILTAAHCLSYSDFNVYVGIQTLTDLLSATPYEPEKILPHPGFDWYDSEFDVGLIKLKKNITLDHYKVDSISIAYDNPPINANVSVVGFGLADCKPGDAADYGICESEHLRYAYLKVVKIAGNGEIYTRGKVENTCYGDSGGPIVYDGKVIAVVSRGENPQCTGYNVLGSVPYNYYWLTKHSNCL